MKFTRPFCMAEAEVQLVSGLACPSCGKNTSARVSLAYPTDGETLIDIACEECGCQWQVKAETASDGVRMRVENDLRQLSVNRIKHMNKPQLAELLSPLGYNSTRHVLMRDEMVNILLRHKRELESEVL